MVDFQTINRPIDCTSPVSFFIFLYLDKGSFWGSFFALKWVNYLLEGSNLYPTLLFRESPVYKDFFHDFTQNIESSTLSSQLVQHEVHFTSTPSSTPSSTPTSQVLVANIGAVLARPDSIL